MADIPTKITYRDGLATAEAGATPLDPLLRKQRILDHLAQSRRARQSSRFDDKRLAALARVQRRLAAERENSRGAQTQGIETIRPGMADRESGEPAEAPQSVARPRAAANLASAQDWLDSLAQLMNLHWDDSRHTAMAEEPAVEAFNSRRHSRLANQAANPAGAEQREIHRLEARANSEKQRADFITNLLEQVLSSSTASLVKHQARLEALQSQINALQGR